jgi:beta-galactosidase
MDMFRFGVDYYPEHWPEERWQIDARLMQEAGINVVRLAEFAWSKMEPENGRFDFDWLDRIIALLGEHGIQAILGTPTASAPPWLMQNNSEAFRLLEKGQRETYGNRRNYCPNNSTYQDYSRRIVQKMAEHYSRNPNVIGWQTDNEFGQGDRCCCPVCVAEFHRWLQNRYTTVEEMNERWGTVFWSQVYNEWSEVPPPLKTGNSPNPGLALDYYRFSSDSYVLFQNMQIDILRKECPNHFITHNFMGFGFGQLEYFDLAKDLDFVSLDIYPRTQWRMEEMVDPSAGALSHDTMRGLKRKNHWVMEQQSGPGGWDLVSVPPRPGELRLCAYQSIAHGADGVIFFRWRTARFGTEQYWHGLLDHDGYPGRRYAEIQRMGRELALQGDIIKGSQVKAQVAFLNSYDSRWAFQIQGNNPGFDYPRHFSEVYRSFHKHNVNIDVVSPEEDLLGYRIVVAPALHVVTDPIAENLERFVKAGGVLVLTARSGVKDEANAVVNQRLPGRLSEMAGVEVEEYDSLPLEAARQLELCLPGQLDQPQLSASVWVDVLNPTNAEVVGRYIEDYYTGKAAITWNNYGQGRVLYVGTLGQPPLFDTLAGWLLEQDGSQPAVAAPQGVEVMARWQNGKCLLFVLNHTGQDQTIELERSYTNLLNNAAIQPGSHQIASYDVWLLVDGER